MHAVAFSTVAALLTVLALGCGHATNPPNAKSDDSNVNPSSTAEHTWWCSEHGVPEEVCGQCNSKLAAEFQKKGDWCKEHDRPDSQCFVCHPELAAKFAAKYVAKFGKQPPKPE
jgi:cobalt-zinc-cadmium efflux system membrane fusion protein